MNDPIFVIDTAVDCAIKFFAICGFSLIICAIGYFSEDIAEIIKIKKNERKRVDKNSDGNIDET